MKLKFTSKAAADPASESPSRKSSISGGLKLNFKVNSGSDPNTAATGQQPPPPASQLSKVDEPKPKRKYTKRAKPHDDGESVPGPKVDRKRKLKDETDSKGSRGPAKRPNTSTKAGSITLRIASSSSATTDKLAEVAKRPKIIIPPRHAAKSRTASTPHIRIKSRGVPPPRPVAQGYDSEAEDIEVDPAIESQIILRMQPGDDCDYLHRAIQEKKIGMKTSEGGADASMRFLTERRAVITIRGRHYAACLLELPCVVEAMKSWDRRGWYKAADICQVLFVVGRVNSEDEARSAPLPSDVNQKNHQYPHGLTPPMHLVRKRRFRKRVSNSAILEVESEVRRLLQADDEARSHSGKTEYTLIDVDETDARGAPEMGPAADSGRLRDDYGAIVPGYEEYDLEEEAEEEDEMAELMAQSFAQSHQGPAASATLEADITAPNLRASPESLLPVGTRPESGPSPAPTDRTAATGDAERENTISGDDDDGEDFEEDEEDEDDEVEVDETELARQQELTQLKEEVEDLRKEIVDAERAMQKQANPLLKQRAAGKVRSLREDLRLKLASLGQDEGE